MPQLKRSVVDTIVRAAESYSGGYFRSDSFRLWIDTYFRAMSSRYMFEDSAESSSDQLYLDQPDNEPDSEGYLISPPKLIAVNGQATMLPAQLMERRDTRLPMGQRPKHWRLLCKNMGLFWPLSRYLEMNEVLGWKHLPDAFVATQAPMSSVPRWEPAVPTPTWPPDFGRFEARFVAQLPRRWRYSADDPAGVSASPAPQQTQAVIGQWADYTADFTAQEGMNRALDRLTGALDIETDSPTQS
jgi:hypothetical protein